MMEEINQPAKVSVPDEIIALGVEITSNALRQNLGEIAQLWQQAQQVVASKSPQQPIDPAVQKTYEAAMAEIQRKQQVDATSAQLSKAKLDIENQRLQFEQSQVVQQMQHEFSKQQAEFQNEVRMFSESMQQANAQLQATIEKNNNEFTVKMLALEQGNEKLRQESEAKDRELADKMQSAMSANRIDLTPHIDQMHQLIGQIRDSKNTDTLDAVLSGMHNIMQILAAPSDVTLIKSPDGKTIGARKTIVSQVD